MSGFAAVILAAAAGFNPWLTLLLVVGAATYSRRLPVVPGFEATRGTWLVALLAIALGLDVAGGKLPGMARTSERLSGPVSVLAGAVLCLAIPNVVRDWWWPAAAMGGALVAAGCRLARRSLALALREPMGRYRYGYVLASMVANLTAAVLAAIALATLVQAP